MKVLNESKINFDILFNELKNNNPIIIPTDTNFNLCTLPNNKICIDKIFEYKNRSKDKPLSLFIAEPNNWKLYGTVFELEVMEKLVDHFWPGPLNIIIQNTTNYYYMLNDSKTISLGCVANKTMRNFIKYIGSPVAITSANISGTANNLLITESIAIDHMKNNVNYLLKNKYKSKYKSSSTIIHYIDNKIKLLREGDIKFEEIKSVVGDCVEYE